jgi:hypothetical protein
MRKTVSRSTCANRSATVAFWCVECTAFVLSRCLMDDPAGSGSLRARSSRTLRTRPAWPSFPISFGERQQRHSVLCLISTVGLLSRQSLGLAAKLQADIMCSDAIAYPSQLAEHGECSRAASVWERQRLIAACRTFQV